MALLADLRRDLRLALRLFAKSPGLSLLIVGVLAIAIAANTTVFSAVYARLLRPLPYPEPQRLVQLWEVSDTQGGQKSTLSPLNFLDWQEQSRSFESMAVYGYKDRALMRQAGDAEILRGVRVSPAFFDVLGIEPQIGHGLASGGLGTPSGDAADTVVLSHAAWRQRFGGDPDLVGQDLTLDGRSRTVVGIMPPDFAYPTAATEAWIMPAYELAGLERSRHFLFGVGRLRPGVSIEAAQADLSAVAARLAEVHPGTNGDSQVLLVPLRQEMVGDVAREILLLWGGVAMVLVLACANLASLLLARLAPRRRELAVRRALGGRLGQIVRQLLTESALLAVAGGGTGVLLALAAVRYLASGRGPRVLRANHLEIDPWVLAFSAGVTLATVILLGLVPALTAGRRSAACHLREAGSATTGSRSSRLLPRALVAFQTCVAIVLLTVAALLVKSLVLLHAVDVGFDPRGVVTFHVSLAEHGGPEPGARAALYQRLVERLSAVPGVAAMAGVNDLPFSGSRTGGSFEVAGHHRQPGEPTPHADYRTVVGDYFRVMGLEIVAGEGLPPAPAPDGPRVAVVNRRLVERFLGGGDAIGRELILHGEPTRIVGVVEDLRHSDLRAPGEPEIYVPASQGQPPPWLFMVARTGAGDGRTETGAAASDEAVLAALAPSLRAALGEVLPGQPLSRLSTLRSRLQRSLARERSSSVLFSAFAAVALLLAVIGIWGTVSHTTAQRRREIAIRMALGGGRGDVLRPIFLHALAPALLGIAAGLALSVPAARALGSLLFAVAPGDPSIFLLVPAALALIAALATYLPARRAAAVSPAVTLRES